jgi:hypothetical protein
MRIGDLAGRRKVLNLAADESLIDVTEGTMVVN